MNLNSVLPDYRFSSLQFSGVLLTNTSLPLRVIACADKGFSRMLIV